MSWRRPFQRERQNSELTIWQLDKAPKANFGEPGAGLGIRYCFIKECQHVEMI
jgi:hypothetical protein